MILKRSGTLRFPVQVSITLESGRVIYRNWDDVNSELSLSIAADVPASNVSIDTENRIEVESSRMNNVQWRVEPPKPIALLDQLVYFAGWLLGAVMP